MCIQVKPRTTDPQTRFTCPLPLPLPLSITTFWVLLHSLKINWLLCLSAADSRGCPHPYPLSSFSFSPSPIHFVLFNGANRQIYVKSRNALKQFYPRSPNFLVLPSGITEKFSNQPHTSPVKGAERPIGQADTRPFSRARKKEECAGRKLSLCNLTLFFTPDVYLVLNFKPHCIKKQVESKNNLVSGLLNDFCFSL